MVHWQPWCLFVSGKDFLIFDVQLAQVVEKGGILNYFLKQLRIPWGIFCGGGGESPRPSQYAVHMIGVGLGGDIALRAMRVVCQMRLMRSTQDESLASSSFGSAFGAS